MAPLTKSHEALYHTSEAFLQTNVRERSMVRLATLEYGVALLHMDLGLSMMELVTMIHSILLEVMMIWSTGSPDREPGIVCQQI
jgi:hypothetical protein